MSIASASASSPSAATSAARWIHHRENSAGLKAKSGIQNRWFLLSRYVKLSRIR
jgi:hypothetical protein